MSEKYLHEMIDDIEILIDEAKPARFNPGKVVIDRDVLITVIEELRKQIPGEVERSHKVMMNKDAILFAMANPVPEIMPDLAKEAGAKVVGTGRSDFPNQVNNVVAFPGIFKGALEGRASQITEEMKLATAKAIAGLVPDDELNEDNILPEAFDPRVADTVSKAVKELI